MDDRTLDSHSERIERYLARDEVNYYFTPKAAR